jgi:adenylate kinase family enzyme
LKKHINFNILRFGWEIINISNELYEDMGILKNILVTRATGGNANGAEYIELRNKLLNNSLIKDDLPRFVKTCRSLNEFWSHIKEKSPKYQGRRDYLRNEFDYVLNKIENHCSSASPLDKVGFNYEFVQQAWQKAIERRTNDPEGAITMARTLLESSCKHIMDEANYEYDDKAELPQLYKGVQKVLNLAPSENTEQVFKEILSGCVSVVKGLGAVRNKLSDAHGKGQNGFAPSARHAQLAVNLSGTMSSFLVSSWEEKKDREGS